MDTGKSNEMINDCITLDYCSPCFDITGAAVEVTKRRSNRINSANKNSNVKLKSKALNKCNSDSGDTQHIIEIIENSESNYETAPNISKQNKTKVLSDEATPINSNELTIEDRVEININLNSDNADILCSGTNVIETNVITPTLCINYKTPDEHNCQDNDCKSDNLNKSGHNRNNPEFNQKEIGKKNKNHSILNTSISENMSIVHVKADGTANGCKTKLNNRESHNTPKSNPSLSHQTSKILPKNILTYQLTQNQPISGEQRVLADDADCFSSTSEDKTNIINAYRPKANKTVYTNPLALSLNDKHPSTKLLSNHSQIHSESFPSLIFHNSTRNNAGWLKEIHYPNRNKNNLQTQSFEYPLESHTIAGHPPLSTCHNNVSPPVTSKHTLLMGKQDDLDHNLLNLTQANNANFTKLQTNPADETKCFTLPMSYASAARAGMTQSGSVNHSSNGQPFLPAGHNTDHQGSNTNQKTVGMDILELIEQQSHYEDDLVQVDPIESNITLNQLSVEQMDTIVSNFNLTIPNMLLKSLANYSNDKSIILVVTDLKCALFKFPMNALFELIRTANIANEIHRISTHPNDRYIAVEFKTWAGRNNFKSKFKVLDDKIIVTVDINRSSTLNGSIKDCISGIDESYLQEILEPFGKVTSFTYLPIDKTFNNILSNKATFRLLLKKGIVPTDIPTVLSARGCPMILSFSGVRPQCFYCGQRTHLIKECLNRICSSCGQKKGRTHRCRQQQTSHSVPEVQHSSQQPSAQHYNVEQEDELNLKYTNKKSILIHERNQPSLINSNQDYKHNTSHNYSHQNSNQRPLESKPKDSHDSGPRSLHEGLGFSSVTASSNKAGENNIDDDQTKQKKKTEIPKPNSIQGKYNISPSPSDTLIAVANENINPCQTPVDSAASWSADEMERFITPSTSHKRKPWVVSSPSSGEEEMAFPVRQKSKPTISNATNNKHKGATEKKRKINLPSDLLTGYPTNGLPVDLPTSDLNIPQNIRKEINKKKSLLMLH